MNEEVVRQKSAKDKATGRVRLRKRAADEFAEVKRAAKEFQP